MATIPPAELQYQLDHKDDDASRQLAAFFIVCMVASAFFVAVRLASRRMMRLGVQADDYTVLAGLVWMSDWDWIEGELLTPPRSLRRERSSSCSSTIRSRAPGPSLASLYPHRDSVRCRTGKALGNPYARSKASVLQGTFEAARRTEHEVLIYTPILVELCLQHTQCLLLPARQDLHPPPLPPPVHPTPVRQFVWFGIVFLAFLLTSTLLVTISTCTPIRGFWDSTVQARCINVNTFSWTYTIANVVTDVYLLILPVPMLWSLKIPIDAEDWRVFDIYAWVPV